MIFRAILDISDLRRSYRDWCGLTNALTGLVQLVEIDQEHECELWEINGATSESDAYQQILDVIGNYRVIVDWSGPAGMEPWPVDARFAREEKKVRKSNSA